MMREAVAQNLVPNPGFEEYLENPNYSPSGVNAAPGWSRLENTADFFHAQYAPMFSVPDNFRGYQEPATGEGYAGIFSFAQAHTEGNEFLVAKLNEPLQKDQIYDLSFEVNLSNRSRYGVDGIGAVLLNEEPTQKRMDLGEYEYFFRNDYGRTLTDTVNWIKQERQFRAEGGEQYY
jgi:hypothetical protein